MRPIVIVGSGLAGYAVARELRKLDRDAPLAMITADSGDFYSKPMLSNALAARKTPAELVGKPSEAMARDLGARIVARSRVERIDPASRTIAHSAGELAYSSLVLAVGADPVRLPLAGDGASQALSVNDLDDYARLRQTIEGKRRVAILGAGLIGCEFANDLAGAGHAVDVVDVAPQPLGRLLPGEAASAMREALGNVGVRWHLGRSARAIERDGTTLSVVLDDGARIEADAVLSAVGLKPRTALARAAGLAVNGGIVVDRFLRTSDRSVYAVGDCAEIDGMVRPFVLPIMQAARALASTLAGREEAVHYPLMPIVVKTPALPAVICAPPARVAGTWRVDTEPGGVVSRYVADGRLRGFALLGSAVGRKQHFLREMQPC